MKAQYLIHNDLTSRRGIWNKTNDSTAMLQDIADTVWHDARQYNMEAWKEFFKQKFLGCVELPKI